MSNERYEVHSSNMDIVQRLMAEKMIGQFPLKALDLQTARVKNVLSTDLPDVKTKDDKADTLYLLEDDNFLHVEYQTSVKRHDAFRFARYVLDLYNKYKDNKEISKFLFQSVVIYAPHIIRSVVNAVFDIGAIRYNFFPLFLNEVKKEDDYEQIVDKIRQNPDVELTEEEKMVILYRPLFNSTKEEIENKALNVLRDIQELADSSEKAKLTGTLFVLVKKYLSLEGQEKIWEALEEMDIVRERFEQKHQMLTKELLRELLVEAIKEGDSSQSINRIIKKGNFSEEEVEAIYREVEGM